ncbi:unnamed protein product, partial [Amoebophrya sp. A25]|eukprot:GSA25T00020469001.1
MQHAAVDYMTAMQSYPSLMQQRVLLTLQLVKTARPREVYLMLCEGRSHLAQLDQAVDSEMLGSNPGSS